MRAVIGERGATFVVEEPCLDMLNQTVRYNIGGVFIFYFHQDGNLYDYKTFLNFLSKSDNLD